MNTGRHRLPESVTPKPGATPVMTPPARKYRAFPPIALADRQWPNRTIEQAPIWMSTDLRDGNQALFEPMDRTRKMRMFKMLCEIGFQEIEVAFPSASQTDFDFVRELIEGGHIPDNVTIEVLTQARPHLIERTVESLSGAKRAIVHVYNAISPVFRDVVFNMSKADVIEMAVSSVRQIRELTAAQPQTEWILEYSPELFSSSELPFAKEVVDAVTAEWGATPTRKVIINLPATVEMATPNVYADQIEWMHRNIKRRDAVVLSVHPHNDRGCAVAAAELAVMAGADRIEGCLFGNGERTGNVDIVTLALNLYSQGIDPKLDFSNINEIARTAEACTQLPVHPRHPYAGDLVFTAFSGSHQDAIKKGFSVRQPNDFWEIPYLPIDPEDLGRSYDSIIRVNSQSGKGGIAYLLEQHYGIVMPRRMQVEFSGIVQKKMDQNGGEFSAEDLWELFNLSYTETATAKTRYQTHELHTSGNQQGIDITVAQNGHTHRVSGTGNGPIEATMNALQIPMRIISFEERSVGQGADANAIAIVEMQGEQSGKSVFGAGIHANIVTASIMAVIAAGGRGCVA
ncbi:2-isopropylmalate synthase [gamma proteobacterium HdN1]|nr:2-isopropylmalate synthase [gamma proteobacterium HdN1]